MCASLRRDLIIALIFVHGWVATAIGMMIAAIATNSSFWGIAASISIMATAAISIGIASSHSLYLVSMARNWYSCVILALDKNHKPYIKCNDIYDRLIQLLIVLQVALGIHALAAIAAVPWGAIPWVGAAVMSTIMIAMVVELGTLVAIYVLVSQLSDCLVEEVKLDRGKNPLTSAIAVLTCPLNKSECADNDLQVASRSSSGIYSTSRSLAILLDDTPSLSIISLVGNVIDSYSSKVMIDTTDIHAPGTHSIYDNTKWAVRLYWSKLSAAGLRIEPAKKMWTVELHSKLSDGTSETHTFNLMVTN